MELVAEVNDENSQERRSQDGESIAFHGSRYFVLGKLGTVLDAEGTQKRRIAALEHQITLLKKDINDSLF